MRLRKGLRRYRAAEQTFRLALDGQDAPQERSKISAAARELEQSNNGARSVCAASHGRPAQRPAPWRAPARYGANA